MLQSPDIRTPSVLLIDGNDADRAFYADELKACSPYQVVEAPNGQSGLDLYRSQRIDCVVTDLALPDKSGFEILTDLVPVANKPQVAVIILTRIEHPEVGQLAKQNGAYDCFVKAHTSGADLDSAIQDAMALVRLMPKKDRYRAV